MGSWLSKSLGGRYFAIATSFYEGSTRLYDGPVSNLGICDRQIPRSLPYFLEATLVKAVSQPFFLDLHTSSQSPEVQRWMHVPRPIRTYGAVFEGADEINWPIFVWPELFDGFIEIPRVTAARGLPVPPA